MRQVYPPTGLLDSFFKGSHAGPLNYPHFIRSRVRGCVHSLPLKYNISHSLFFLISLCNFVQIKNLPALHPGTSLCSAGHKRSSGFNPCMETNNVLLKSTLMRTKKLSNMTYEYSMMEVIASIEKKYSSMIMLFSRHRQLRESTQDY